VQSASRKASRLPQQPPSHDVLWNFRTSDAYTDFATPELDLTLSCLSLHHTGPNPMAECNLRGSVAIFSVRVSKAIPHQAVKNGEQSAHSCYFPTPITSKTPKKSVVSTPSCIGDQNPDARYSPHGLDYLHILCNDITTQGTRYMALCMWR
jgi:hypothetical protein